LLPLVVNKDVHIIIKRGAVLFLRHGLCHWDCACVSRQHRRRQRRTASCYQEDLEAHKSQAAGWGCSTGRQ